MKKTKCACLSRSHDEQLTCPDCIEHYHNDNLYCRRELNELNMENNSNQVSEMVQTVIDGIHRLATESPMVYTPIQTLDHCLEILRKRQKNHTGLGAAIMLLTDAIERLKQERNPLDEKRLINVIENTYYEDIPKVILQEMELWRKQYQQDMIYRIQKRIDGLNWQGEEPDVRFHGLKLAINIIKT